MPDLTLNREFPAPLAEVFRAVTEPETLLKWWGPEGFHISDNQLDFRQTGPWSSVMVSPEGQSYHVSGQVTHVTPEKSIGFTWAWHDETGARGAESHVTIALEATAGGTRLTLSHRDLATAEAAEQHESGWVSTLKKLEPLLAA